MKYSDAVSANNEHYDHVRWRTPSRVNQKLDFQTECKINDVIAKGPEAIKQRLRDLDQEWDIDRVLMLNFAVLVIPQLLAARKNKKWLWGPILQTPFMLMQAVMGWCPPSLWFRPMGFRTRREIQSERDVLLSALSNTRILH